MRALLLAAALLPCLAQAAIHQCTDAAGHKVFSDVPCGPDAKVIQVAPPGGPAPGMAPMDGTRVEYYDVSGASIDELAREMRAKGADGWAGTTWTDLKYHITMRPGPDGCRIDAVNATFDARVRLPRWAERSSAPPVAQQAWDALFAGLERHERGHVTIGQEAAGELERAVRETPAGGRCADLAAAAKGRADAVLAQLQRRQREYDERTDHGTR
jgi:predicted secreted Zn-dependent protease